MFKYLKLVLFVFMGLYVIAACSLPSELVMLEGESINLKLPVSISAKGDKAVIATGDKPIGEDILLKGTRAGNYSLRLSVLGIPVKNTSVNVINNVRLAPWGRAAAMEMYTDGVLVLGTGQVHTEEGRYISPCNSLIRVGDLIKAINGNKIENKRELIEAVAKSEESIDILLLRDKREVNVNIQPAVSIDTEEKKLGLWVRDSTKGIGTVTCFDESGRYYALGHPVTDVDTGELMPIKKGKISLTDIVGVNKGKKGNPGELLGATEKSQTIGNVEANTTTGIYGSLDYKPKAEFMDIALKSNVKEGRAELIACVDGNRPKAYTIEIENKATLNRDKTKAMVIRITDKRLIEKTGGIVQGMSGAPIVQDNKIVGAVTHVFVQEPERGYGIYIEDMLLGE